MTKRGIAISAALATALGATAIVFVAITDDEHNRPDRTLEPESAFPGASNTGVPDGTALARYSGACAITTANTTITDARVVCDRLLVQAAGVVVRRSMLPRVEVDTPGASILIEDSEVDAGAYPAPAVGYHSITLHRVEVRGGQTSVLCTDCTIERSWLHAQMRPQPGQHLGGYLSNGGSRVLLRGNTIECTPQDEPDGGGCTGGAQIIGDFEPLSDYTFDGNLFVATAGGYCASFGYNPDGKPFGDRPRSIVVVDNVFQRGATGKCGQFGGATSFLGSDPGSVWRNNRWDDGEALPPP